MVAPEKKITKEFRFVVSGGKILTGCQYIENDELECSEKVDDAAYGLAKEIAGVWQPDELYTLDICKYETDFGADDYALLELNSFSSSAFYLCDYDKIAGEVNKLIIHQNCI